MATSSSRTMSTLGCILTFLIFHSYTVSSESMFDCQTGLPVTGGAPQPKETSPYKLTLSADEYNPGMEIEVTVTSAAGTAFEGFFIKAQEVDDPSTSLTGFRETLDGTTKVYDCGGIHSSAIANSDQVNTQSQSSVEVTWQVPETTDIAIHFVATVVKTWNPLVFWEYIKSDVIFPALDVDIYAENSTGAGTHPTTTVEETTDPGTEVSTITPPEEGTAPGETDFVTTAKMTTLLSTQPRITTDITMSTKRPSTSITGSTLPVMTTRLLTTAPAPTEHATPRRMTTSVPTETTSEATTEQTTTEEEFITTPLETTTSQPTTTVTTAQSATFRTTTEETTEESTSPVTTSRETTKEPTTTITTSQETTSQTTTLVTTTQETTEESFTTTQEVTTTTESTTKVTTEPSTTSKATTSITTPLGTTEEPPVTTGQETTTTEKQTSTVSTIQAKTTTEPSTMITTTQETTEEHTTTAFDPTTTITTRQETTQPSITTTLETTMAQQPTTTATTEKAPTTRKQTTQEPSVTTTEETTTATTSQVTTEEATTTRKQTTQEPSVTTTEETTTVKPTTTVTTPRVTTEEPSVTTTEETTTATTSQVTTDEATTTRKQTTQEPSVATTEETTTVEPTTTVTTPRVTTEEPSVTTTEETATTEELTTSTTTPEPSTIQQTTTPKATTILSTQEETTEGPTTSVTTDQQTTDEPSVTTAQVTTTVKEQTTTFTTTHETTTHEPIITTRKQTTEEKVSTGAAATTRQVTQPRTSPISTTLLPVVASVVALQFTLVGRDWHPHYADPTSAMYLALEAEVRTDLNELYQDQPHYYNTEVVRFIEGSVIPEVQVIYSQNLTQDERRDSVNLFYDYTETGGTVANSSVEDVKTQNQEGRFEPVDACLLLPCPIGMVCEVVGDSCQASCESNPDYCQNGGTCTDQSDALIMCQCPDSYEGDRCEVKKEEATGPESDQWIGIAVGITIGVIILCVFIFIVIRSCRKSRQNTYSFNLTESSMGYENSGFSSSKLGYNYDQEILPMARRMNGEPQPFTTGAVEAPLEFEENQNETLTTFRADDNVTEIDETGRDEGDEKQASKDSGEEGKDPEKSDKADSAIDGSDSGNENSANKEDESAAVIEHTDETTEPMMSSFKPSAD